MALRPTSVPQCVVLSWPPASSLPDLESDLARAACPTVTRLLATLVTGLTFSSPIASGFVTELVDFDSTCCLDYTASLVSESDCPLPVGGELAFGCDILEDRQLELECFAAAVPHLAAMLLAPEGDPDALDIPTPHSHAEVISVQYTTQWQTAMDADMASWKVKRPPGSPHVFKASLLLPAVAYPPPRGRLSSSPPSPLPSPPSPLLLPTVASPSSPPSPLPPPRLCLRRQVHERKRELVRERRVRMRVRVRDRMKDRVRERLRERVRERERECVRVRSRVRVRECAGESAGECEKVRTKERM
ncbi:unnamed protein product [Closterium sp. NIES-53]